VSKFHNVPKRVDGILFHSGKEARRYVELRGMERAGIIRDLELQPRYRLEFNGERICDYIADFRYHDNERRADIVEDVKGVRTEVYKLKKRLMKALLDIEVEET
jgi:hypothetical protein